MSEVMLNVVPKSDHQDFGTDMLVRRWLHGGWKLHTAEDWGISKIICNCKDEKSMLQFKCPMTCELGIEHLGTSYSMINCNVFCKTII